MLPCLFSSPSRSSLLTPIRSSGISQVGAKAVILRSRTVPKGFLLISAEVEGVADGVHVAEDGGVENAGVAFGHLDAGVAEHTRDVLQADALREAECGVGVASGVHRQVLVDFTDCGNLFEIAVHHLIAGDWKQHAFLGSLLVALIFLNDGKGNVEQRNVTHLFCLLAGLAYPFVAVVVGHDMVFGQLRHIGKCKSCESGHQKHIAYNFQPFAAGIAVVDTVNLLQCKELRVGRVFTEFDSDKRVFLNPIIGKTAVGYLLQSLHVADKSILAEVFLGLEIHLVSSDYFARKIREREVVHAILLLDEFAEVALHRFIPSPRYLHKVLTDEFLRLVVVFLYHLQDCALLFSHLTNAIKPLLNNQRVDFYTGLLEFSYNLVDSDASILYKTVKING